jgi:hypothetical protein
MSFIGDKEGRRKFGNGFARADVTDVRKKEEGRRKKEDAILLLAAIPISNVNLLL